MEKFIAEHKDKDLEYEYMFHQRIENHAVHTTIVNPERGGYPWYTNKGTLCFLDAILLGWIQRLNFDINSVRVEFTIEKRINE